MESQLLQTLLFETLENQPSDPLLGLIGLYRADLRPTKIDVGVGVYRDDQGLTPVMRSVKRAEERLVATQATKSYLGAEGDTRFVELLAAVAFGDAIANDPRLIGVQTPGGTGALRLAAELIARARPSAQIWMGTPTWANHAPIFTAAGLAVRDHPYFDEASGLIDFPAMADALGDARPGDVVLIHGCCHNPTGADLSIEQWRQLASLVASRQLVPFIDLAYQGLGAGLEEDAAGTRLMIAAVPETIIAYSCDKNFGLYRDRVGALWVSGKDVRQAHAIRDNILSLARSLWSMPPDHGAALVREILEDDALSSDWRTELNAMRGRIADLRIALAAGHPALAPIGQQHGMFAMLPISRQAVFAAREDHGIYMADSGRINIAGLRRETIAPFVEALLPYFNR